MLVLDSLYLVFIQPIEILLGTLFAIAENMHHSKNVQIILLSLMVSLLLVPIYNLFDYWQNRDRDIEKAMNPKLQMIKRSFKGQERFAMLKTVYRQFGYHPIYGVRNSFGFLLQIPFFIAAYQYLSYNPALQNVSSGMFKNLSAPDQLIHIGNMHFNLLPIVMTVINLCSGFIYTKGMMRKERIQMILIALVFLVLLYNTPAALVLYWTFNNVFSLIKNVIHRWKSPERKVERFMQSQQFLPYLSMMLFITIAFLYFPSALVASDPAVFQVESYSGMLLSSFYNALIIGLYLFFVVKYFILKGTRLIDISVFVIAVFALLTSMYNIYDTGALDHFTFTDIENRLGSIYYRMIVDLTIIVITIVFYHLISMRIKQLLIAVSIAVFSIFSWVAASAIPKEHNEQSYNSVELSNSKAFIPAYFEDITIFSNNHPNILVLLLDGFTNPLLGESMIIDPSIRRDFTGFTWFENTLATGTNTFLGEPAIQGGFHISPYIVNQRSESIISLEDELNKAYVPLFNQLAKNSYVIDLINAQYTSCQDVQRLTNGMRICTENKDSEDDLNSYYMKEHSDKLPMSISEIVNANIATSYLPSVGLFYSSFYSLRDFIYNDARWITLFDGAMPTVNLPLKFYAFLTSYVDEVKVEETGQPTYKYITSNFPHSPWHFADETCRLVATEGVSPPNSEEINQYQLYTSYCAIQELRRLVINLKENNAYDNTMIIVVSDHSFKGDKKLAEIFSEENEIKSFDNYPAHPSSLLLVKDFNSSEGFKVSDLLMSPADVPAIICAEIGGCDNIHPDPRAERDLMRKLIYTIGEWHPRRHNKTSFNLSEIWEVTGDMYQRENWKKIEEKPR